MEEAAPYTLLALAAGYLFTRQSHFTSFRVARLSGYHLLFESAIWGAVLVGISQLLLVSLGGIDTAWTGLAEEIWRTYTTIPGAETFALAFVLGVLLPRVINLVIDRDQAVQGTIRQYGTELEKILYNSLQSIYPVSFTLKNEKVYIGWPLWTPEASGETRDLAILPAYSGFRDSRTKRLAFTTEYLPIYDRIREGTLDMEAEDFQIVLPLDEIRTASFFSLDLDQSLFEISETTD